MPSWEACGSASNGRLPMALSSQAWSVSKKISKTSIKRITVLEAASVPNEPSSPNRKQIAALGVLLGLGLAGGLFFLLELLNQVIRRPIDIVKALDITPLATLPNIETASNKRWRRTVQIMSLLAVIAMVPTLLWVVDTYYMPLDLLFEKIKDRIS